MDGRQALAGESQIVQEAGEEGIEQRKSRAALFVDFDNIYSGLKSLDEAAAEAFATNPESWMTWLGSQTPDRPDSPTPVRSLLIRRVYLNPASFGRFRPYFVRSGFQVVDCPTLTGQGKNSADILMVMDVLETLEHPTRFDEFILLSGDSDFTPLLLKLRAHDRRTAVLAAGLSAAAYRAACDDLLSVELFIERGLGLGAEEGVVIPAERLRQRRRRVAPQPLQTEARQIIQEIVQNAQFPLVSSTVATALRSRLADKLGSDWGGAGSFRAFVERLGDVTGVSMDWRKRPGYFYDPDRHQLPPPTEREVSWAASPRMAHLAGLISEVTEAPLISTVELQRVFEMIAEEVNASGYSLADTSRRVRDRCREEGIKVARQGIGFILKSLAFSSSLRGRPGIQPAWLAADYASNLISLARRAQVDLLPEDEDTVVEWICGTTVRPVARRE